MPSDGLPTSMDSPENRRKIRFLRAHLPLFIAGGAFRRHNAHGIGIGPKSASGKETGKLALRVYVSCKLPKDRLPPERRVPKTITIPAERGEMIEIDTDIVEMAPPSLIMDDPESALRPVPGGTSISIPGSGGNGTLGAWVFDRTDDTVVALSNRHVTGGTNGAPVIQPGSVDGGSLAEDRIGTVKRHTPVTVSPADPTPDDCNFIDAGVIMADDPDLIELITLEVGPAIYEIGTAAIGDPVQKSGQTTGHTTGQVIDTDYALSIPFPLSPGNFKDVVFCDCYLFQGDPGTPLPGVVSDGDSGSILFGVVPASDSVIQPAIGLVFAQSDGRGVACKIQTVFNDLDLDVICASGYPAYLDGIAAGDEAPGIAATRLTSAERNRRAGRLLTAGLARSVERRLLETGPGRNLSDLVRTHRHDIFLRLLRSGDFRRAATDALMPVLRGARTSDDVFSRTLTKKDAERIQSFLKIARREGLKDLEKAVEDLPISRKSAIGKRVGTLLKLDRKK